MNTFDDVSFADCQSDRAYLDRCRRRAGMPAQCEDAPPARNTGKYAFHHLAASEWSNEFIDRCMNRRIIGAMRYGRRNAPGKPQYDRVAAVEKAVKKYRETGNDELLVDAANLLELEYVEGTHPLKHFVALDDEDHVAVQGIDDQ